MKDYYNILEIGTNASEEVIKAAYKALVRKYHSDTIVSDENSERRIREINEAYAILRDPVKKKEYDQRDHKDIYADDRGCSPSGSDTNDSSINHCDTNYIDYEKIYQGVLHDIRFAETIGDYGDLIAALETIKQYKNANELLKRCRKELFYLKGSVYLRSGTVTDLKRAANYFERIAHWRDADSKLKKCNARLETKARLHRFAIYGSVFIAAAIIGSCLLFAIT